MPAPAWTWCSFWTAPVACTAAQEDPGVVFRVGLIAESLGEEATARDAYRRFIKLQPQNHVAYNQLAWLMAARKESLDEADILDELQPNHAGIQDTLGWTHLLKGENDRALEHPRRALDLAGWSRPIIGYNLAQAELAENNPSRAQELL